MSRLKLHALAAPLMLLSGFAAAEIKVGALRDALEQTKEVIGAQGIFTMSAQNHNGMDNRARIMMTVKNGRWTLLP
jgi:branched-chain amino acid transport system substrate-binding protein